MAITMAPGAHLTLGDHADGFVVHVTEADDVDAAMAALGAARADIAALAGGPAVVVSEPVMAPGGPLLRVARLDVDEDVVLTVPDLVTKRLLEAGVGDAVIDVPEPGGPLDALDDCPNAVVLRLFPAPAGPGGTIPASWIDIACEWVLGDLAPTDAVPLRLLAVEFAVPVSDAPAIVHQASQAHAWCDVVNGNLGDRVRTASVTFGGTPHVALAAGGPACDSNALLARFDLLCEVARDLAPEVAYACVDIETTFEGVGLGLGSDGWRAQGGASPNLVAGRLVDTLVPDAFPFQVIGPGHLERFVPGADIGAPPLGDPLPGDRIEVVVGDPADWLPIYDARDDVHAEGLSLLAPLLATQAEAEALLAERPGQGSSAHGGEGASSGVPDLDDIRLETLPHSRRGLRLTFLELVAWLAHEPHSDAPASVSPVLATYARWFASAIGDERRQELKGRARRLIGTSEPPPRGGPAGRLGPRDEGRAWATTDWLIRVQAACWLRAAGLVEAAGRLEGIGPVRDHVELVRAVDVMSSALVIAAHRIELTTSMAATGAEDDATLVDEAAWEAWERASEIAGWVAASEAAGVGIPAELAYMTDLRVIECARDARAREELEAAGRTIGDAAWAAALHAMAAAAVAAGWEAAHGAVDALAVVPLRTAVERATRATAARLSGDDDRLDLALEQAEQAAVERLARATLGSAAWKEHEHPWDAAREAAATVEGGELWAAVQDLARAAVDEGPWRAGMEAARAAVDEVLTDAPALVARAVGAALAREAAGVAARGMAVRASAVARARGADALTATDAAHDALAPVAADLQQAAFSLLDALIDPPTAGPTS